jgi:serine/threonine-protein kinase
MQHFGRYEVTEELGSGAMGAVYKAVDPTMGRDVAIKTIVPHVVAGPQAAEFRDRFFKEARAAGRLSHPGIVTIYDFAEQDGIPFLVMEYVQGRTLQSLLESERLTLDRAFDIGIQLSEALDYAHRNGVIHRDIKPANILVTADGRAKIADFGIAKLNDSQLTTTGQVLGTPAYMAPELFTAEQIDGRADLFSVGIVLYWMTTGDKPFSGESIMAVQYKVMHTDPVPPRKLNPLVSRDLEAVILKALAKDRNERYPTGAELAHDLRELRAGHPVSVTHPTADSPAKTVEMTAVLTSEPSSRRQARIIVPKPRPERVRRNRRSGPKSIWRTGLTVIFIVLMVSVVKFLNKTPEPPEPAGVGPLAPALPAPLAQQPPVPLPTDPTRKGSLQTLETISLELNAKQQSGAVFRTEGQPDQSLAMKPGDSVTLHARGSAVLILSSRSALQGKLNGKPISFGEGDGGGEFQITPLGVEDRISLPPGFPPGLFGVPGDVERGSKDGGISSPRRQKELAQSPSSVRLIITSPGIPENVALVVRVDDVLLYRRAGTNAPASVLEQGSKRLQLPGGPSAPFTEERFLPAGRHKLRVNVQLGAGRLGETEEVMGEFEAGQRRTLSIQFGRGAGNRFRITLD